MIVKFTDADYIVVTDDYVWHGNWLCSMGHRVTTKLYSSYRYEIIDWMENKDEVKNGIIAFIDTN